MASSRICPHCGTSPARVIDSREEPRRVDDQLQWSGEGNWRRRKCTACGWTWQTEERITCIDGPSSSATSCGDTI